MRLSALRIDDGTDTRGCLPLQRMTAPIRQRLRHVHAGVERQPDSDRPDEEFTRTADSGNEVTGVFCPECGVRIYHVLKSAQDVLSLKPGTLDETSWLRPGHFIWMKSAQGWVPVPDGVKALLGQT
jgi:hypothetical protein